jgi:hypothetical protein
VVRLSTQATERNHYITGVAAGHHRHVAGVQQPLASLQHDPVALLYHFMNQQFWCFGKDIEAPQGNLLVRRGMTRQPPPPGIDTGSAYRMDVSPTRRVMLRGFGAFYGNDRHGGLFLSRSGKVKLTPEPDLPVTVWTLDDLPPLRVPASSNRLAVSWLLMELFDWFREYEYEVIQSEGLKYRREVIDRWRRDDRRIIEAEATARSWRLLGLSVLLNPNWAMLAGSTVG